MRRVSRVVRSDTPRETYLPKTTRDSREASEGPSKYLPDITASDHRRAIRGGIRGGTRAQWGVTDPGELPTAGAAIQSLAAVDITKPDSRPV